MARRALVVGINHYNGETPFGHIPELENPVNDARAIAKSLDRHYNDDDNFAVESIYIDQPDQHLRTAEFYDCINTLFEGTYESVVLYFAGHGVRDELTQKDYLVTTDGTFPNYGVDLDYIVNLANSAYPRIHNITIILDCCHAGFLLRGIISGPVSSWLPSIPFPYKTSCKPVFIPKGTVKCLQCVHLGLHTDCLLSQFVLQFPVLPGSTFYA